MKKAQIFEIVWAQREGRKQVRRVREVARDIEPGRNFERHRLCVGRKRQIVEVRHTGRERDCCSSSNRKKVEARTDLRRRRSRGQEFYVREGVTSADLERNSRTLP
jgi:hypothetical protein